MTYKKFDQKLFDENDRKAREWTSKFLISKGFRVKEHPNKYAQDLVAEKDGKRYLVECEVKHTWTGGTFRFPTLQLPERKKKFCNEYTIFFVINSDLTQAFAFSSELVLRSPLVEVANKYKAKGERFFQIPVEKVKRVCYP